MSWEQLLISVLLAACYRPDARQLGWQVAGVRGMFIMWAEALPGFSCVLVHNPNWRPGKAFL